MCKKLFKENKTGAMTLFLSLLIHKCIEVWYFKILNNS